MRKTQVVNVKTDEYGVFMARPSIFGNPFKIGVHGDRQRVISLYKDYFYTRLEMDAEFRNKVLALKGKRLGCFCSPQPCHADVIVSFLEGDDDVTLGGTANEIPVGSDGDIS